MHFGAAWRQRTEQIDKARHYRKVQHQSDDKHSSVLVSCHLQFTLPHMPPTLICTSHIPVGITMAAVLRDFIFNYHVCPTPLMLLADSPTSTFELSKRTWATHGNTLHANNFAVMGLATGTAAP